MKIIELTKKGEVYKVDNYAALGVENIAQSTNNTDEALQNIADVISDILSKYKIKTKHAAIALSNSKASVKVIEIPDDLLEDEVETQITMESERFIPYAIDEVYLDFKFIAKSEVEGYNDYIIVAAKTEDVEFIVDAVEMAGLKVKVVDIESYTTENSFRLIENQIQSDLPKEERVIALIDIGASTMTINIFYNGKSIYMRENLFGGNQLTDEIKERYGISREEAGFIKKKGGLPDTYEQDILNPFIHSIIQEVSRFLHVFYSSSRFNQVDQIVLCGGTGGLKGLDKAIEEKLAVKTIVANPVKDMEISSKIDKSHLYGDAPALMTAVGLALRSYV